MDSHEIPLALLEKLQDLLPVRFGFLGSIQFRHGGGVRAQDFAYGHAGDSQHPRDLAFAHCLRVQFQNRGALRLAQHAVSSPVGLLRRCGGVGFECARSDAAQPSLAGDPTPRQRRPPAAAARGSQSPPPFPAAPIPSSRCDRTGAPTRPPRSRNAVPTLPIASPPPAPSRVRISAASGPTVRPRPRSSATPRLPPCPGPVAPELRSACSR